MLMPKFKATLLCFCLYPIHIQKYRCIAALLCCCSVSEFQVVPQTSVSHHKRAALLSSSTGSDFRRIPAYPSTLRSTRSGGAFSSRAFAAGAALPPRIPARTAPPPSDISRLPNQRRPSPCSAPPPLPPRSHASGEPPRPRTHGHRHPRIPAPQGGPRRRPAARRAGRERGGGADPPGPAQPSAAAPRIGRRGGRRAARSLRCRRRRRSAAPRPAEPCLPEVGLCRPGLRVPASGWGAGGGTALDLGRLVVLQCLARCAWAEVARAISEQREARRFPPPHRPCPPRCHCAARLGLRSGAGRRRASSGQGAPAPAGRGVGTRCASSQRPERRGAAVVVRRFGAF